MKIVSQKYGPRDFSHGQVQEMLVTLGKNKFSPSMADLVANAKSGFARKIVGLFSETGGAIPVEWQLRWWEFFYRGFFKYNLDISGILVPEKRKGFDRMLVLAEPAMSHALFVKSGEYFDCWKAQNASLDEAVIEHERNLSNGSYVIWVEDTEEPNERLKNISANRIREEGLTTETLPERLLHGFVYYLETGRHLDLSNWTLCSGSRYFDGCVPNVGWGGSYGEMYVRWTNPSVAIGDFRSREVVS